MLPTLGSQHSKEELGSPAPQPLNPAFPEALGEGGNPKENE